MYLVLVKFEETRINKEIICEHCDMKMSELDRKLKVEKYPILLEDVTKEKAWKIYYKLEKHGIICNVLKNLIDPWSKKKSTNNK